MKKRVLISLLILMAAGALSSCYTPANLENDVPGKDEMTSIKYEDIKSAFDNNETWTTEGVWNGTTNIISKDRNKYPWDQSESKRTDDYVFQDADGNNQNFTFSEMFNVISEIYNREPPTEFPTRLLETATFTYDLKVYVNADKTGMIVEDYTYIEFPTQKRLDTIILQYVIERVD